MDHTDRATGTHRSKDYTGVCETKTGLADLAGGSFVPLSSGEEAPGSEPLNHLYEHGNSQPTASQPILQAPETALGG